MSRRASTYPDNDGEFEDRCITEVIPFDNEKYEIGMGALHLLVESPDIIPKAGDIIRTYGSIGYPVRGVFINDEKVYYRTIKEEGERHKKWVEDKKREDKAKFEENKEEMDRKVGALPDVFQRRIQRYRSYNPDFRWEFEEYEVFCCEQAVAIADALKTPEAITQFHDAEWDEQKRLVPELNDGHSGNTFGTACVLAKLYVTTPEFIPLMHGAMAVLTGCEEYGCPPASKEEVERVESLYKEVKHG